MRGDLGGQKGRTGRVEKEASRGSAFPLFSPLMNTISVSSAVIAPTTSQGRLTPAMTSIIWEIAAVLDEKRIPAIVENSVWLSIPTKRLRGSGGRTDNHWLRQCLSRLMMLQISGEYRGDSWDAVIVSQANFTEGGSLVKILIPPAAVQALRSAETFAKIEVEAAHRLKGPARRLYAILADKKRLGRPSWSFQLEELRALLGVEDKPSYQRWQAFKRWVLAPALAEINEFGTVDVQMTPEKEGRSVAAVRFTWKWKSPDKARETSEENERHSRARRRQQASDDAPPIIEREPQESPALDWWGTLEDSEREAWSDRVGRTFEAAGSVFPRREKDIARDAFIEATRLASDKPTERG